MLKQEEADSPAVRQDRAPPGTSALLFRFLTPYSLLRHLDMPAAAAHTM